MIHPNILFPGAMAPIFEDLSQPLHDRPRRDRSRQPRQGTELSLAQGWRLQAGDFAAAAHADVVIEELRRFLSFVMDAPETENGIPIVCRRGMVPGAPAGTFEAHGINVTADGCEIVALDVEGLRRGVFRLEDEMLLRRAPILPLGTQARWTKLRTRITRCPVAPYRWLSGWELEDDNDYYPEEYLNRLAHYGINGLWVPALLRNLVASRVIPELGPPQHRLEKLNALIERAARHGIGIHLFVIEPRSLPRTHPAALAHPEILGAAHSETLGAGRALCSSVPLVLDYVREVTESLFREAPRLAGLINIFCGERLSNCWMNAEHVQGCPRCRLRSRAEVHGEVLDAFIAGMRAAGSSAEFMGWTYLMAKSSEALPTAPMIEVMEASSPEVIWLGNFEHGIQKRLFDRDVAVNEYSMTCVGPSPFFSELAGAARERGRRIYAKFQMGTTFEMSSVPYIPVPSIAYQKLSEAVSLGVTGCMLSWIIGGFPSPTLHAAGEAAFEPRLPEEEFLLRLAAIAWGEKAASETVAAWKIFAEAWQLYPVHNSVLLWGPMTRAPAYQLHLERETRLAKPYNWGLSRTREPQPFEDGVERWIGFPGRPFYSVEEIASAFRAIAEGWSKGLARLECALRIAGEEPELKRQFAVAAAVRLQCLATANVYEFYHLRDQLRGAPPVSQPGLLRRLGEIIADEKANTREMKQWIAVEPAIGFQSEIYGFSYSPALLDAKLLQLDDVHETLRQWELRGVDPRVLNRTVEEVELARPDDDPGRWGD